MTDLVSLQITKGYGIDRDEATTRGVIFILQVGPIVLELWCTKRPRTPSA